MKEHKKFNDIEPNPNMSFEVSYYYLCKTLRRLMNPLIKAGCNDKIIDSMDVISNKAEQMASKYKGDKAVYEKRKVKYKKRIKERDETTPK